MAANDNASEISDISNFGINADVTASPSNNSLNQEIAAVAALALAYNSESTPTQIEKTMENPESMITDPFPDLPRLVDIAGEKYSFDRKRTSGIELFMKPYEDFFINFGLNSSNNNQTNKTNNNHYEFLVRAYLPYGLERKSDSFSFVKPEHRDDLIKLIDKRIQRLSESSKVNVTQTNLKRSHNFVLLKNYQELKLFLKDWKPEPQGDGLFNTPKEKLKKATSLIDKIPGAKIVLVPSKQEASKIRINLSEQTEEEKMEIIYRLMFYALHPDKLDINILREWQTLLDWSKNAGPKDFFQQLKNVVSKSENKEQLQLATPYNYLKRLNISKLEQSKNQESALDVFKKSIVKLNSNEESERTDSIESLKRLLLVLSQQNYITKNTNQVSQELADKLKLEIQAKLPVSTLPLFKTLQSLYDPLYQAIIKTFESRPDFSSKITLQSKEGGLLSSFLELYDLIQKFQEFTKEPKFIKQNQIFCIDPTIKLTEVLWDFCMDLINNQEFINNQHGLKKEEQYLISFPNTFTIMNPPHEKYSADDKKHLDEILGIEPKRSQITLIPSIPNPENDGFIINVWNQQSEVEEKIRIIGHNSEEIIKPDRNGKTICMEALRIILIVLYQKALEGKKS